MRHISDDIFLKFKEKSDIHYVCDNDEYIYQQLITYIGNKRKLFGLIKKGIYEVQKRLSQKKLVIFDGFSGSGSVSRLLKPYSKSLTVNDLELYSKIISECYLSNVSDVDMQYIGDMVSYLNENKFREDMDVGFIEDLYAPKDIKNIKSGERVFYTPRNARILDNIRRMVGREFDNHLFIAPLLSEASVHTNTGGVFNGFYRNSVTKIGQIGGDDENCKKRIEGEIHLHAPVLSDYECDVSIYQEDINTLISKLPEMDLTYYDPPYNKHPYGSNYFMLNLICNYERPNDISKISGIPKDWNRSSFNTPQAEKFLNDLIENTKSKFILLSYSDEGTIPYDKMISMLSKFGKVKVLSENYIAYGASRNFKDREKNVKEFLFILEK
jgi:adenine-specific DNA-methyltransferase